MPPRPSRCAGRAQGRGGRDHAFAFRFTGRRWTRPSPISARRRCRPTSPQSAPPDERDAADYQTMFAVNEGAVAAPTAGLHFTPALEAALRDTRHRHSPDDPACRGRDLPAGQGRGHRRAQDACRMGHDLRARPRDALNAARAKRRPHRRGRHDLAAASGKRRRGRRHDRAVRRRDRDLHHAGLSLSRGRYSDDQFSSAALDAVHAGLGLQRSRDHEAGLCPCDRAAATGSIPMATPACCFAHKSSRMTSPIISNCSARDGAGAHRRA